MKIEILIAMCIAWASVFFGLVFAGLNKKAAVFLSTAFWMTLILFAVLTPQ